MKNLNGKENKTKIIGIILGILGILWMIIDAIIGFNGGV